METRQNRDLDVIKDAIKTYKQKTINKSDLDKFLSGGMHNIKGGYFDGQYTGYDYTDQSWVVFSA